jgi:hypothetical protein
MTEPVRQVPAKQRSVGRPLAGIISRQTKVSSACIALAGTTGTNVSAWMAGARYGLAALALEAALLISVVVLLASLPAERVDRLFRAARLLLDRPEYPAPVRQPATAGPSTEAKPPCASSKMLDAGDVREPV